MICAKVSVQMKSIKKFIFKDVFIKIFIFGHVLKLNFQLIINDFMVRNRLVILLFLIKRFCQINIT